MDVTAIVMAAGEGTRMKSNHAKVMHKVLGKPMVCWVVDAALKAGCTRVVVVIGSHADEVQELLDSTYPAPEEGSAAPRVETVVQSERLGTGHAVRIALEGADISNGPVAILTGDAPLIEPSTINKLMEPVADGTYAGSLLTWTPDDPYGYGRLAFNDDGSVARIIEQKDCTPEQAENLRECNPGFYAFDAAALRAHIGEITTENVQHEYYLTDMIEILQAHGLSLCAIRTEDAQELLGVNSRAQLAQVTAVARDRINARLMDEGVTFIDPAQAWIGPDAQVGRDTVVWPQTHLIGACTVGEECQLGPNTRLTNTRVGDRCVVDETVALSAVLEDDVDCGPRAYLRPGTHMLDHSKAGTHVEIKNSTIGEGSKVPHLSYIGDTQMGSDVNVGAGSITCNYDGKKKNHTTIGDRTFIGSDTMMVAPVNLGSDVITGAGGTITEDVPDGALALERTDQQNIEGFTRFYRRTI